MKKIRINNIKISKYNHKYNRSENNIARMIYDLKTKQNRSFNKWHDLDLQINILKSKLGDKYNENKVINNH